MLIHSEQYYSALYEQFEIKSSIHGTITAPDGDVFDIADRDIIPGSLTKNSKCVNGNSFEFGAVFQSELDVTLRKQFDRYKIKDGVITFTESRFMHGRTAQQVKIGEFKISSVSKSGRLTTIKAADCMDALDADIVDGIVGTPYQLLAVAADECGIELEQSEAEIEALPNGTELFSAFADTAGTYRDMVAYIGMVTGTFAVISVNGRLKMCSYHKAADIVIPASKRVRNSTVVEDYRTYYRGVTARFIADENYARYTYMDEERASGLIMDLGDIPIVRGLPSIKHSVLEAVYGELSQIEYVPASFTICASDAALELGDKIQLGGEGVSTYITSYTWVYHGSEPIKGVGDNPRLKSGESRITKRVSDLEQKINVKDTVVHSYTNSGILRVSGAERTIIAINYAAVANAHPIFLACVPFTIDRDGYIVFKYYMDGVIREGETIRQYVQRGEHFVTLCNNFVMEKDSRVTLSVSFCTEYFESDTRRQEARILSLVDFASTGTYAERSIDTTVPSAVIAKGGIRAVLFAQGLAGAEAWDGTLSFAEEFPEISTITDIITVRGMADALTAGTQVPAGGIFSEAVSRIPVQPGITVKGFSEQAGAGSGAPPVAFVITNHTITTAQADTMQIPAFVGTDGRFQLKTQYTYTSEEQEIDSGRLDVLGLPLAQFDSVESVVIA